MATQFPDPLARRHLLEGDLDVAKAKDLANRYLAAGREIEAIDFLAKAEDREALASLQKIAVKRGDVFLMKAASRGLDEDPSPDRWRELAEVARSAGRAHDAEAADRLAAVDV